MDSFINVALLSNPKNWLTISAMLLIVAFSAIAIQSRMMHSDAITPDDGTTQNVQPET